ncbi:class I SAM-dependent methyltransferase [Thiothrix eikelboomii]|uniref:class I SAM-dependent methyltransferase n=1 Tax=Thiothrix eikelboomii TaxID=92487 RepID=UPI003BB07CC3
MTAKRDRKSATIGSKKGKAGKAPTTKSLKAKAAGEKATEPGQVMTLYAVERAALPPATAVMPLATPGAVAIAYDIALPLTSRAVFWQPRHIARSRSLRHVPFLFWLMETIRPNRVVQLGMSDPACFLALCQAADKLGLEAICMGVDLSPEKPAMSSAMAEQHATLYGDFSFVVTEDFARAVRQVQGGQIDLLVIDTPLSDEHVMALRAHWMPLLSERAVLVFHDPDKHVTGAEARQYADSLLRARPGIRFPQADPGLDVVLLGSQQPERLTRMAELEQGMPGYLAAWQVFARLGQGLENDQLARTRLTALNKVGQEAKEAEAKAENLAAELAKERQLKQGALDSEADQIAQTSGLQAQVFDLQTALDTARGAARQAAEITARKLETLTAEKATEVEALQRALKEETEKRKGHWQKLETLTAEKASLETALTEARSALDQATAAKATEVEALKRDLRQARSDRDAARARHETDLQAQREAGAAQLASSQEQAEALSKANARLQEQVKQMLDKRLALWETHEALKQAHATLQAQLESRHDS